VLLRGQFPQSQYSLTDCFFVFSPAGGEFAAVTQQVLPGSLRSFLECRVAAEEEGQAGQAVGSYYHEGFKRKVYTQETVRSE
jgi:hypothetical protein